MKILCIAKDSHILLTKNNSVFVILMFEIVTNRLLTMSLIFNWAHMYIPCIFLYQMQEQVIDLQKEIDILKDANEKLVKR